MFMWVVLRFVLFFIFSWKRLLGKSRKWIAKQFTMAIACEMIWS